MFNGQQQQPQQQQNPTFFPGGNGQGYSMNAAPNNGDGSNGFNQSVLQALFQQQQMQQARWQQQQQMSSSSQEQLQQQPNNQFQQQFQHPNPLAAAGGQPFLNPAMFNQANNAHLPNAMSSGSQGSQNPLGSSSQMESDMQQQQQPQPQQGGFNPQAYMASLGTLNPQQLQAMIAASASSSTTGNAGMGGINPAAMMGNALYPGQQQQSMMAPQQQQQFQTGMGGDNMDQARALALQQALMQQNMGGAAAAGPSSFPGNGSPFVNGNLSQPRPSTSNSMHSQAGDGTPDSSAIKSGAKPRAPKANKKTKGSVKAEATPTPTMSAATIPGSQPNNTVGPSPLQASMPSQMQQYQQQQHRRSPSIASQQSAAHHQLGPQQSNGGPSGSGPSTIQPPSGVGAGWHPELTAGQQSEVMQKAWQYAKTNGVNPAEVLGKMKLIWIKSDQLPGGASDPEWASKWTCSGGAVLQFKEAQMLGLLGPGAQGGPDRGSQPPATPRTTTLQQHSAPDPSLHASSPANLPVRRGSGQSRPESRSGLEQQQQQQFQPGMMGPPGPMMGGPHPGMARRPSMAVDPHQQMSQMDPHQQQRILQQQQMQMQAQQQQQQQGPGFMRPPSMGLPPGSDMSGGPSVAQMPSSSSPFPEHIPGHMAPLQRIRRPTAPPAPDQPPVFGGALPQTTAKGYPVSSYNTKVTPLPNFDRPSLSNEDLDGASWLPMTQEEERQMFELMAQDAKYEESLRLQASKTQAALRQRESEIGPLRRNAPDGSIIVPEHLHWWERIEDEPPQAAAIHELRIIYPEDRRANLREKKGGRIATTEGYIDRLKRKQLAAVGSKTEDLVPIRLELDHEAWRLRDTFTWNANDDVTSYEEFARNLCEDYGLPEAGFVHQIREQLTTQVGEHISSRGLIPSTTRTTYGHGTLTKQEEQWWAQWREATTALEGAACSGDGRKKLALPTEKLQALQESSQALSIVDGSSQSVRPELRITIKLDITVGAMNLIDQFDWDILNDDASAESFASTFASDLGLAGEFKTAIAHSIREQTDVHLRSLALAGHSFDSAEVTDDELKFSFLPGISKTSICRPAQEIEEHTPKLLQLTEVEVERQERERERDAKRKRRATRGRRGINMPDREPLKTQRTPVICGLQNYQIEAAGGLAAVNAAALAAGGGAGAGGAIGSTSLTSDSMFGVRQSTRRAAAAANAHIHAQSEYDTPTPAPEARPSVGPSSSALPAAVGAKRRRMSDYGVHFRFPGGLGKASEDEDSDGPRFAPSATLGAQPPPVISSANIKSTVGGDRLHSPSKDASRVHVSSASTSSARPFGRAAPNPALGVTADDPTANLQPNVFDGQWYCSSCGIPGWLTTTRRKGPKGEKTMCGPCGKHWHRYRKIRPCKYTRDEAYHRRTHPAVNVIFANAPVGLGESSTDTSSLPTPAPEGPSTTHDEGTTGINVSMNDDDDDEDEGLRTIGKQSSTRGGSPDLPFQPVGSPSDSESSDRSQSPRISRRGSPRKTVAGGMSRTGTPNNGRRGDSVASSSRRTDRQSTSPHKTFSAADEVRPGSSNLATAPAVTASPSMPSATGMLRSNSSGMGSLPTKPIVHAGSMSPPSLSSSFLQNVSPPQWLTEVAQELRSKYPHDLFELRPKASSAALAASAGPPVPEWRIRCTDCPGKLYTPGPGESLNNFEVHLKNRSHRANVATRLEKSGK